MFYIYKITNTINGKSYIGKTNNLKQRWTDHEHKAKILTNKPLYNSINKYGINNFIMEIIEAHDNENYCFQREIYFIDYYKTNILKYGNIFGYNLTEGGEGATGYKFTEEQIHNSSISKLGDKNHFYGKHHSDEAKNKISKSRIGKPIPQDVRNKISSKLIGRINSNETKKKKSKAMTGKSKTKEHCNNISIAKTGKSNNRPGSKHHNAKITEQDVIEIRKYFNTSFDKSKDKILFLSNKYNLSKSGIEQIVYKIKWKHI